MGSDRNSHFQHVSTFQNISGGMGIRCAREDGSSHMVGLIYSRKYIGKICFWVGRSTCTPEYKAVSGFCVHLGTLGCFHFRLSGVELLASLPHGKVYW